MNRLFSRLLLGLLVAFQSVSPALASDWVVVEDSCGCALECGCSEPMVLEWEACGDCISEVVSSEDCGCSETQQAEPTLEKASEPVPADTAKPESTQVEKPSEVLPQTATPAPMPNESNTELPAAPIAVPSDPAPATSNTEGLFPGPAVTPPAASPPAELPASEPATTDNIFDEPSPPVAEPEAETQVTEDLFIEPSQPAADETEAPATEPAETEAAETEESAAESNPLDDLFGPSTPAEEPAPQEEENQEKESEESENIDPFGQQTLPSLNVTSSLAGSTSRTWTGLRANFRCEARLVRMTPEGVFLAKATGELVEIAFAELSDADLHFVRDQVRAHRALLASTHLAAVNSR